MPKLTATPRGRPLKDPLPEDFKKIEELAGDGCMQVEIARACGVGVDTLQRWRRDFPEIAEAMQAGLAKEHKALRSVLIEKAMAGDVACLIFALKARHGYREHAPVEQDSRVSVQINLPGALSAEQYREAIEHGPIKPE